MLRDVGPSWSDKNPEKEFWRRRDQEDSSRIGRRYFGGKRRSQSSVQGPRRGSGGWRGGGSEKSISGVLQCSSFEILNVSRGSVWGVRPL